MLVKPKMYDETNVNEEFERLTLGGHKGVIAKAEEYTSEISGKTSLKVYVDTAKDDEQPEYFRKIYENDTRENKKYPNGAIKYVSLGENENQVRMLKSFITSVENSNNGYTYDWNKEVDQLRGKKIGLVFGNEEYLDNEGHIKLSTKLTQFRSIDKVKDVPIPRVKKLDGSYVDYDEYMAHRGTATAEEIFGASIVETDHSSYELEI